MHASTLAAGPASPPAPPEAPSAHGHSGTGRGAAAREEAAPASSPVATAAVWLVPALVCLSFGLYGLGHRQPWQDERATWWAASLSWGDLGRLLHNFDIVLAPYYVLIHFWIRAFGDSGASMRVPSVLAMTAAAGFLALLGRRMMDAGVGVVAGLLFAVLPITTRYSQEARPYAFAVLGAVLGTLLLLRVLEAPSTRRWVAYGVMIPFMGLAHLVTLTVLAAHLVAVLTHARRGRSRLVPWSISVGVGLLPVLPVAYLGHTQSAQISWIKTNFATLEDLPVNLFHSAVGAEVVMAVALFGLLFTWGRYSTYWSGTLLVWAVLPPLLLFAIHSVVDLFLTRYLLFTVPAWSLLAAAGLCAAVRLVVRNAAGAGWYQLGVGVVAVAAVGLLMAPDMAVVRANPLPGEPNWDAAAAWVLHQDQPGDGMAFNGTRGERLALRWEYRNSPGAPKDTFLGATAEATGTFQAHNCPDPEACAAGVDRIWVFSTDPTHKMTSTMPRKEAELFWTQFHTVEFKQFADVRVALMVRDTDGTKPGTKPTTKPGTKAATKPKTKSKVKAKSK